MNGTDNSFFDNYDWGYDASTTASYSGGTYVKITCTGANPDGFYIPFKIDVSTSNDEYQRGVTPNRRTKSRRKVSRRGIKRL